MAAIVLFDTSVLVPALLTDLPHHAKAVALLQQAHRGEVRLHVCTHALAEVFATLTTLPLSPRLSSGQAQGLVQQSILSRARVVPLSTRDYKISIEQMTRLGLSGGAIYDALHVRAAEKVRAEKLYTFNGRDFRRMPPAPPTELVVL